MSEENKNNNLLKKIQNFIFTNYKQIIISLVILLILFIGFQSYNYLPSRKERLDLWEEDLETNNLVLEYITRELPFRKRNDKHNN